MRFLEFRKVPGLDLVTFELLAFSTFDYPTLHAPYLSLALIIYFHGEEILYLPYSGTPSQVRLEIN
jgi:hypothetical protein